MALAYSIEQICALTSVGRTMIYSAIKSGHLVAHKVGRRTVVLADDLEAWLKSQPCLGSGK